jgi:hypothetical protein
LSVSSRVRAKRKRMLLIGGSVAAALVLGGGVTALALTIDQRTPPPVSDQVASAYAGGSKLASPGATPTASKAVPTAPVPVVASTLSSSFAVVSGDLRSATTGQSFGIWDNGKNASGMALENGLLVHGAATDANSASYLESGIGKPVERIAAESVFYDKAGGQIALVAWQNSVVEARGKAVPDRIPNGGIHFVAGPTGWHLGVYNTDGGEKIISSGKLSLAADGKTRYKFEVVRKGDSAWVVLPDGGAVGPTVDPKLAEWTGEWATWELFEPVAGATPAAFASVSAG